MTEVEVARYALRTFVVDFEHRMLQPVIMPPDNQWKGGVCIAQCVKLYRRATIEDHTESPFEGCTCGIHGHFSLEMLRRNYRGQADDLLTVIAAEGVTFIANKGLRTQAARVVAYWSDNATIRSICHEQCDGAECFDDVGDMLAAYELARYEPKPPPRPLVPPLLVPPSGKSLLQRLLQWIGVL